MSFQHLLKIVTEREFADSESIDIKFAYLEVETWENRIVSLEERAGSPSLRAANPLRIEDELMRSRTSNLDQERQPMQRISRRQRSRCAGYWF